MLDCHAHICDPVFDEDRGEVLSRAKKAGVTGIIAVGENLSDARKNLELAETHAMLKPAAGLYPTILFAGGNRQSRPGARSRPAQ
jgi:TatD DNase family protein